MSTPSQARLAVAPLAAALVLSAFSLPCAAQWLTNKTPGIPRSADGKPNLAAAAPRTADGKPDLSGLWRGDQAGGPVTEKAVEGIKAQAWGEALSKKRAEDLYRDDMGVLCQPFGPRADGGVRKVIQTPALIVILYDDLTYRQIFMDGRKLESDPNPSWMGYSVGHWEGDTLIVESNGYNDRTWLDDKGHPHTEALRVTERIRRPDFGHLEIQRVLDDPKALAEPLTVPVRMEFDADTEMIEYVCTENERDRNHLVGTVKDENKREVQVSPEILSRYVGTYEYKPAERPGMVLTLHASVDGGRLMFDVDGGVKRALNPVSETKFFMPEGGAQIEFLKDAQGAVTTMVLTSVEGDFQAPRKTGAGVP